MHIVLRSAAGDRELDFEPRHHDATIDDLLRAALGGRPPETVVIGDRVVPGSTPIGDSGLHEGAVVTTADDGRPAAARSQSGFELVILAGRDVGRSLALAVGRSTIGRTPATTIELPDRTVSREHCVLDLAPDGSATIVDRGSENGTFVEGRPIETGTPVKIAPGDVVEVGAFALTVRPVMDDDRPRSLDLRRQVGPSGTVPHNRPPRPMGAPAPAQIEVPRKPSDPPKAHFSVASTVGPLVMAVVMIGITGNPQYALFMLLTPIIAIGTYVESKRRSTKGGAQSRKEYESELHELERRVDEASEAERERLRDICPDPVEVLRRAALPSTRLWERRPHHEDFLHLYAGLTDLPWKPPVKEGVDKLPPELATSIAENKLPVSPVEVDISRGGIVGIVGDREAALATARSLVCQVAVHHGPADVTVGVFVDPGREPDWEWCKWLPHTRNAGGGGERWLSFDRKVSDDMLRALTAGAGVGTTLVVLDSDVLTEGKNAPARDLLNAGVESRAKSSGFQAKETVAVAGIVVAATRDRLPAACNTVIEIAAATGDATIRRPEERGEVRDVLLAGLSVDTARACARDLARFDDPELKLVGAGLPDGVRLLPLLELDRIDAESVRKRWRAAGRDPGAIAPLGVTEGGTFNLDMIRDGPHGLVGGTTGSGKSELLRSLVAGLAVHTDPEHLTFILMDFKGGAAFDECSRLPHTVGMVTDLDEALGERALEALEAEIQYRERLLRSFSADNLHEYLALNPTEPLPRLLVVIDEFATMAKEFPDFLSALVSVAQRGRTLGVHMLLATQRPSGAVNENIKTNTNLRIALRVQDGEDSMDVIGKRDAAELSRHRPGRAYIRLGPGEIVPIQTALVTCVTNESAEDAVDVAPFVFGPRAAESERPSPQDGDDGQPAQTDLARLVDAIAAANAQAGFAPARRPWPEPLGAQIDLADLLADAHEPGKARPVVALADDPRRQRQYPVGWDLAEGNLLLLGIPGSGTTTTLASLVLSLATVLSPDELEVYALDYGAGDLAPLEGLPHTGSVILAGDRERQMRLIRRLRAELDRRRVEGPGRRIVVAIDNLAAMRSEFDDIEGLELMDVLTRVYSDGRESGIWFAVAADRLNVIPGAWSAITTQKWLFRLPDAYDYVTAGLTRKHVPPPVPGRAVMAETGLQIQVGRPSPTLAEAVAQVVLRYPRDSRRATSIDVLPASVSRASLGAESRLAGEPWTIPFGVREHDLATAELVLYEGDHALIAGPARSGKSSALLTLVESLRAGPGGGELHIAGTGGRRSPLRECAALDRFAAAGGEATAMFATLRAQKGPVVVLIDDAEQFDDGDGAINGLLSAGRPDLHVIAAGRSDTIRGLYGHWTRKALVVAKTGVLLRPNIDLDGDLLGANLPRRAPVRMIVGRGYAVHNGDVEIVQVALPEGSDAITPAH